MRTVLLVSALLLCGPVLLGGCGGGGGGSDTPLPAPTLTAVTPTTGPTSGGATLTLTGTGLSAGGVSVRVGTNAATGITVVNDTTITCTCPAGPRGLADVNVTTAGGTATLPNAFTFQDPFMGTYWYTAFAGDAAVPDGVAEWGLFTSDGLGQVTGDHVWWNRNGVTGDSGVSAFPYDLDANLRMKWGTTASTRYLGGVSPTGDAAVLASVQTGRDPWFQLLLRQGGTFSNASLNGTYYVMFLGFWNPDEYAFWGTATFDGAGGVSVGGFANDNGSLGGPFSSMDAYTVGTNGAFTWRRLPANTRHQGGVLQGGNVVICAGGTSLGDAPLLCVFLKQSTAASITTLAGTYHYLSLYGEAGPVVSWTSGTGTATSDGGGTVTNVGGIENTDGVPTPMPSGGTLTYTILANGALQTGGGISPGNGAVSPDGRFACWTGSTTGGDDPQIWFMMR